MFHPMFTFSKSNDFSAHIGRMKLKRKNREYFVRISTKGKAHHQLVSEGAVDFMVIR